MEKAPENNLTAQEKPRRATIAEKALIAVFTGFVGVFFLLILFLPKHEGELSPNERRTLAAAPKASFQNIVSGGFSKEVDTWMQDHFPGRTAFVEIYSYLNRFTGRNAVEDISLGRGNRLFTAPLKDDQRFIDDNAGRISRFCDNNSLNALSCVIPTAGYMLEGDLPKPHLTYCDAKLIDAFIDGTAGVKPIRAEAALRAYGDVSALYYRTDHHLTMEGSYAIYCAVIRELGMEPLPESAFTKTQYEFYGTSYGKSGLFHTPADTLETWVGDYDAGLSVTTIDGSRQEEHTGSLDMSCLEEGVVDRYAAYLYSNHGITIIKNPGAQSGSLMVVKDSYGNAIVPFLAAHYETIIMVDVRGFYYSSSMPTPSELCEEYGIKDFVVLTGLDTVAGGTLDWLR